MNLTQLLITNLRSGRSVEMSSVDVFLLWNTRLRIES